jgi:hypothetical protein
MIAGRQKLRIRSPIGSFPFPMQYMHCVFSQMRGKQLASGTGLELRYSFFDVVIGGCDQSLLAGSNLLPSAQRNQQIDGTDAAFHDVFYT